MRLTGSVLTDPAQSEHAWNPGLNSQIPSSLLPLVTLYRDENSTVSYSQAKELSEFCGLKPKQLICFRTERLIIHDLLVRVTSDLSVPDGPNYEDLGINLRSMVAVIHKQHIADHMPTLQAAVDKESENTKKYITQQLSDTIFKQPNISDDTPAKESIVDRLLSRFTGGKSSKEKESGSSSMSELEALAHWRRQYDEESDSLTKYRLLSLIRVVDAMLGHRGSVGYEMDVLVNVIVNFAHNRVSAEVIANEIKPLFAKAVEAEGYRYLPIQTKPVVMNVKGASASGKSTIRPQQQLLAEKLDIPWEDFALISPDYWRKYLLDYDSLGEHYKYVAMLTGQELEIIDKKLDAYMAVKADRGEIPHLLIDRFRFDSFSTDKGLIGVGKLLSRFGDQVFLFFMVTPPQETVVRAWERGLVTGRFKAVDDLLHHNIEAYSGMAELFFSWIQSENKRIRFEFLDNDVPKGTLPRTAAFGWNNSITILDLEILQNIVNYRQINVEAQSPDQVFNVPKNKQVDINSFVQRCIETIAEVNFADSGSAKVFASFKNGELLYCDHKMLESQTQAIGLQEVILGKDAHEANEANAMGDGLEINLLEEQKLTLGRWHDVAPANDIPG